MSADDLIGHVVNDHSEIRQLMEAVRLSSGPAREEQFQKLLRKLVVHETAEQEIVHPLLRPESEAVIERRLEEEKQSEILLAELEKEGVDSEDFDAKFEQLRTAVLEHAEREEDEEHPQIRAAVDYERLRALAPVYEAAQKVAPTHPHPGGPTSAIGNLAVGPALALMDRTKDAIRAAREKLGVG